MVGLAMFAEGSGGVFDSIGAVWTDGTHPQGLDTRLCVEIERLAYGIYIYKNSFSSVYMDLGQKDMSTCFRSVLIQKH